MRSAQSLRSMVSARSESEGIYSIGAVASMLGLPPATLRTWEERYGAVLPRRTAAGHRLYSRDQVEQLRFITAEIENGMSAADAHRSLGDRGQDISGLQGPSGAGRPRLLILVAERDEYSAELIEYLLRTEGFRVEVTLDADETKRKFEDIQPHLCVVEFLMSGGGGEELCRWLKGHGSAPIVVVSSLDVADRAMNCGAEAFVRKPVGHLQLISVVTDLLGIRALLKRPDSER
jgi:DNA-binding transcriptional MerR regulator